MGAPILKRSKTQDRLDEARIKKLELDLALKKGSLVLAKDVEGLWIEAMVTFRNKLLALPQTMASDLSEAEGPEDIQIMLDREIRQALTELSDTGLQTLTKTKEKAMEAAANEPEDGAGGPDEDHEEEVSGSSDGTEGEDEDTSEAS